MHLVLGDDRRLLDGLAGLGLALDREVLGERIVGDHHGGSVDAVLTAQTLEALGDIDDPGDIGVGVDHVAKLARGLVAVEILRVLFEAVLQRGVPAHDQRRHRLRDLVANGVGVAEHTGRVAHGGSGLDLAEGHDLGDTVTAVHVSGVADHVVAVAGVEVHVDVGHRHARRVEKALEEEVVLDRVEIGDPERVGHRTASGGAATGPDSDVVVAGVADEIPGDEEIRREPHVVDNAEFVVETFDDLVAEVGPPTFVGAFVREVAEVLGVGREAFGQRKLGKLRFAELDLDIAAFGDPQRVVARFGDLAEESAHLAGGLDVVAVAVELEAIGVAEQRSGLHAQQGVVGLGVVLMGVVRVVRGEDRRLDLASDLEQLRVSGALLGDALILQLDEEVVAPEDVLETSGVLERSIVLPLHQ